MEEVIFEADFGGGPVRYIKTESGRLLYEQRKHLKPATWHHVINGLRRANFPADEIPRILRRVCTEENYFNRTFFRPPRAVVQEQIELFCG